MLYTSDKDGNLKMTVYCCECHNKIDTKRDNVSPENRLIVCPDCTMNRCAGVPKEKIQDRLLRRLSKQRKRNNK